MTENFAREYWKEPAAALGRRIRQNPKHPWRTIVGVVGDASDDGVSKPAPAIVYWPMMIAEFWDQPLMVQRNMGYAVRTARAGSPTLLKEIQQAVWSVNADLPVARVRTLDELRSGSMAQTSFMLVMLAIAAAVALLLGVVGIYGVIAYVATQRTREIGIRIALGAEGRDVTRLFLRQGAAAGRRWHRCRSGGVRRADARPVGAPLRRQRDGSVDVCRRRGRAAGDDAAGQLRARGPRRAGGPGRRAPLGRLVAPISPASSGADVRSAAAATAAAAACPSRGPQPSESVAPWSAE